ncbi:MAG TPA: 3'-5' exonuclease [Pseudobdellovibrionaceae bacterium]|nr:3'-5' exonuclease [Pseudobdellovibrionaceae bacterium]
MNTFIAFDVETTGTVPGVDQIVEIGAVKFVNGEPDALFTTLVNPQRTIPPGASAVNGITNDMVANKPLIESLLPAFAEFCADHVLVAHNAPFDTQFISSDIKKYQAQAPRGIILDTLPLARKLYPGLPNYKLGTLIQHLKIPTTQFHRAEEDATYCGRLFLKLVQRVSPQGHWPPLENLVTLTGKPALLFPKIDYQPKQMTFF